MQLFSILIPAPFQDAVLHYRDLENLLKDQPKTDSKVKETVVKMMIAVRNLLLSSALFGLTIATPGPIGFFAVGLVTWINSPVAIGSVNVGSTVLFVASAIEIVAQQSWALLPLCLFLAAGGYLSRKWYQYDIQKEWAKTDIPALIYETQPLVDRILNAIN